MEASDRVAPPDSSRMRAKGIDTGVTKMNLKSKKMNLKTRKCFQKFSALHEKLLCEILYYTCWALAHIVHVIGTSGKQPMTRD